MGRIIRLNNRSVGTEASGIDRGMVEVNQQPGGNWNVRDRRVRRVRRIQAGARRRPNRVGPSRFISAMKIILPVIAVLLLATVTVWPHFRTLDTFRIELAAVGPAGGGKPQVLNARLLGVDEQSRPFQITAELGSSIEGAGGEQMYKLDQPKADITLEDGTWIALTADNGLYERTNQTLFLSGRVNLFHDSGYEFTTETATVDVDARAAEGYEHVEGHGPHGFLESEGFRIRDEGQTIIFTGRSKMTVTGTDLDS